MPRLVARGGPYADRPTGHGSGLGIQERRDDARRPRRDAMSVSSSVTAASSPRSDLGAGRVALPPSNEAQR